MNNEMMEVLLQMMDVMPYEHSKQDLTELIITLHHIQSVPIHVVMVKCLQVHHVTTIILLMETGAVNHAL